MIQSRAIWVFLYFTIITITSHCYGQGLEEFLERGIKLGYPYLGFKQELISPKSKEHWQYSIKCNLGYAFKWRQVKVSMIVVSQKNIWEKNSIPTLWQQPSKSYMHTLYGEYQTQWGDIGIGTREIQYGKGKFFGIRKNKTPSRVYQGLFFKTFQNKFTQGYTQWAWIWDIKHATQPSSIKCLAIYHHIQAENSYTDTTFLFHKEQGCHGYYSYIMEGGYEVPSLGGIQVFWSTAYQRQEHWNVKDWITHQEVDIHIPILNQDWLSYKVGLWGTKNHQPFQIPLAGDNHNRGLTQTFYTIPNGGLIDHQASIIYKYHDLLKTNTLLEKEKIYFQLAFHLYTSCELKKVPTTLGKEWNISWHRYYQKTQLSLEYGYFIGSCPKFKDQQIIKLSMEWNY